MPNIRLATLLDRCPLGDEDCHNIMVIFDALTLDRQQYILDHWEEYIAEMIMVRKEIDTTNKALLEEALEMVDTLKDAQDAREAEMRLQKFIKQKEIRLELEGVQQYQQKNKLNLIRSIAQFPDV